MPHGMGRGNNNGYTPLNFDLGIRPQATIGQQRSGSQANSNPVRPGQPAGEPTAYAEHSGTRYYDLPDGRSVYQQGDGPIYDRDSGAQVFNKGDESGTYDGAFSIDPKNGGNSAYVGTNLRNTDNQVIDSGKNVWKVPDSTLNNGRDDTRTNANGVVQKGTDMSRSFNDLLATTNTSGYQPFSSNQLPTTAGSPDSKMSPMTQAITNIGPVADGQEYANNLGRQGTSGIGPLADGQVYGNALENAPGAGTKGIGPLADGAAYAKAVEGKGKSTSRLDAALSDTAGMQSYMSKFSSGDQERLANRAFLDTKGSMEGLRAKEAVNGVVYAQGQHYTAGSDADGPANKITRGQARDISNGDAKAQDFLAKKTADTVAAVKQAPAVLEQGAKDGAFQQDKPMFGGSTPAIGGAVEFDNNNDNTLPTFGNTGGYKSGFKKIDTTMPNPFGG